MSQATVYIVSGIVLFLAAFVQFILLGRPLFSGILVIAGFAAIVYGAMQINSKGNGGDAG